MLDRMTYTNHLNETITFGEFPYFANYSSLRDYDWEYNESNNKILNFKRHIVEYTLPVVIMAQSESEGYSKRNALFETVEKDILNNEYGTLQVGQYKLKCFVKSSVKSEFLASKRLMNVELTFITDLPYWTKETTYVFTTSGGGEQSEYLDYPFDFPYDYKDGTGAMRIVNSNFTDTNFRVIIYGSAVNPRFTINDHIYQVNVTVETGQILTIDSVNKTIVLTTLNGTQQNKFSYRYRSSYIFEKVPTGDLVLTRNANFRFDLTLIEERSEPKWT